MAGQNTQSDGSVKKSKDSPELVQRKRDMIAEALKEAVKVPEKKAKKK